MRCRALPCGAAPCCAVLRRALTRTYTTWYHAKYQVPGTGTCVCTRLFVFFIDNPVSVLSMFVFMRIIHPYCRSERDIANKHTAQRRAISSAQVALGINKSLVASNHRPLLSASSTFIVFFPALGLCLFLVQYQVCRNQS